MKTYSYTVNNGVQKGTYTIQAQTKNAAITIAKHAHPIGGVNVSSFRVVKETKTGGINNVSK